MNTKRQIREEEKKIIQFLLAKLNTNEAEYPVPVVCGTQNTKGRLS